MIDFLVLPAVQERLWLVIIFAGLVTYATRFSGYFILSRFRRIHPRVEAALEAVPAAVLVTIVLPPAAWAVAAAQIGDSGDSGNQL